MFGGQLCVVTALLGVSMYSGTCNSQRRDRISLQKLVFPDCMMFSQLLNMHTLDFLVTGRYFYYHEYYYELNDFSYMYLSA